MGYATFASVTSLAKQASRHRKRRNTLVVRRHDRKTILGEKMGKFFKYTFAILLFGLGVSLIVMVFLMPAPAGSNQYSIWYVLLFSLLLIFLGYGTIRSNKIEGESIYAGLLIRLLSSVIDCIILILPIYFLSNLALKVSLNLYISIQWLSYLGIHVLSAFLLSKYGGTPGKLIAGLRVTQDDFSQVSFKSGLKRSSIDLVFSFFLAVGLTHAIILAPPNILMETNHFSVGAVIKPYTYEWYNVLNVVYLYWLLSEFFVMNVNSKRKAIHDYIANTVVVEKNKLYQVR
ncbi:RDD family protein [Leptospira koniambonensis]|uniref:RDD family protein n=1 Tax=Leptospira koniambonensis TaxID=2484950 RepID=A0A4R9J622_9LEPT|nr:RDD family protein [Leptospira koniambonensis]TGL31640.1 RDD family protein [Leptospira koniambonensis]